MIYTPRKYTQHVYTTNFLLRILLSYDILLPTNSTKLRKLLLHLSCAFFLKVFLRTIHPPILLCITIIKECFVIIMCNLFSDWAKVSKSINSRFMHAQERRRSAATWLNANFNNFGGVLSIYWKYFILLFIHKMFESIFFLFSLNLFSS